MRIAYKYPENNAYYGYMTRGCIRNCSFCAVPTLPPKSYNPKFSDLLKFYTDFKNDINDPKTEFYALKQEYNSNPTRKLRRKKTNK